VRFHLLAAFATAMLLAPFATSAQTSAALAPAGGEIAYVQHPQPPALADTSAGSAAFALVGSAAAIASGQRIVSEDGIEDPNREMARTLAVAYAVVRGGSVSAAPILDPDESRGASPAKLAEQAGAAKFVVDVDAPYLNLTYFSFDLTHFDLLFATEARIIDTSNNRVVSKARCFLQAQKSLDLPTHEQLLANNGAALKDLIARKSHACVDEMKAKLKL
jgi:hypothetical protein